MCVCARSNLNEMQHVRLLYEELRRYEEEKGGKSGEQRQLEGA
jgi:hypothetical protein